MAPAFQLLNSRQRHSYTSDIFLPRNIGLASSFILTDDCIGSKRWCHDCDERELRRLRSFYYGAIPDFLKGNIWLAKCGRCMRAIGRGFVEVGTFLHALTGVLIQMIALLQEVHGLVETIKGTDKSPGKVRIIDSRGREEVIRGRVVDEARRRWGSCIQILQDEALGNHSSCALAPWASFSCQLTLFLEYLELETSHTSYVQKWMIVYISSHSIFFDWGGIFLARTFDHSYQSSYIDQCPINLLSLELLDLKRKKWF